MVVAAESGRPHVALLPSPGMGHIIPLLEMAKRLALHHGFHVSFISINTEASAAQTQLLRSPNLPSGLHVVELPPADMSTILHDDMTIVQRICLIVQESLPYIRSVLRENPPRALIVDIFCTDAFQIAKDLSIPTYSFFTASTALLALSLYLPTMDREIEGEYVDLPKPVQVPGCNAIRTEDLLNQVRNRKIEEYKWYLLSVSRLPMAVGIFVNTWEDLEPVWLRGLRENSFFQQIPIPPVLPIGPLIKEDEPLTDFDHDCIAWLDKQQPDSVLFISLGSGGTLTYTQLTELAWGLELSQQRFILVVRTPSDASASGAFFNVGNNVMKAEAYLPQGFVERTQEAGLVIPSWAPQVAVLRHPSTGGFLSHCGWNSTLESISHGVPMIAWPLYAEQRMNATMLTEEVGVAARPVVGEGKNVVGREEIERVVRLVMEGEEGKEMRRRVRELQSSALATLKPGGPSFQSLSEVAGTWTTTAH
ncbi:hypothetical protein PVL29_023908 [Vitis rotundifolia]|uniref:Glycosyltransferase n=1 Tax=Vitis rotundifolia TaxID=103349 RepID=A0AA38YQD8_VITRO|nr:hypothetical protein PVL29_023908 [Vitis rotundifolia]